MIQPGIKRNNKANWSLAAFKTTPVAAELVVSEMPKYARSSCGWIVHCSGSDSGGGSCNAPIPWAFRAFV